MSKDTLQLPKTAFSMKASLPLKEPEILKKWEKNKIFEKRPGPIFQKPTKKCVLNMPPFVRFYVFKNPQKKRLMF